MRWRGWAIVLLLLGPSAWAQPAPPTEKEALPPPLTHYQGREIAPFMTYHGASWLVRPERQREEDCETLLAALQIKPGQAVGDLGCGNGFYTLKLAELVGKEGRVLAVDIQPEMLRLLEEAVDEADLSNVEPVLSTPLDPCLPAGELDLVLLVDVYHEMGYPEQMLAGIRRSLKPTGRMVLVEFRAEDPAVPIKPLHKMSKRQLAKEIPPNGFRLVEEFDKLPWQHVMFYQRDEERDRD